MSEIWTAHYWRHQVEYREECDSLEAAVRFLKDGEEMDALHAVGVVLPDETEVPFESLVSL